MGTAPRTIGAYEIKGLLGTGRHGHTYLAYSRLGEKAALREIVCDDHATAQRLNTDPELERLAAVIAGIAHPDLADILEVFAVGKRIYVAEEFLETPSLAEILDKDGPLPVEEVWAVGCQLLTGLEFGHLRGLLHLDLRSKNVHYDRARRDAILNDLGHMQLLLELQGQLALAEIADEYHAPEVVRGEDPTPASDVYSVGVILHEMLTGGLPGAGTETEEAQAATRFRFLEVAAATAEEHGGQHLEELEERWPGVVSVVRKALAPAIQDRYQRAGRMQNSLARAYRADCHGKPFSEEPTWVIEEEREQEQKRPPARAVRVEGGVRFCEDCGRPMPPGAKMCLSCGRPRRRPAPVRAAPQRREPQSYFQRHGDQLLVEGKYQQAEEAYRMAARRSPDDPVAQRDLADVLAVNRKFTEAEEAYRAVLRSDPDDLEARHELGRVLVSQGKGREALQELNKVLGSDPGEELRLSALTQLGAAHATCRDHESARQAWKQVLKEDPRNARVLFCIGSSYMAEDNEHLARKHLREALRADPDFGEARDALRRLDQRARAGAARRDIAGGWGPGMWMFPGFWQVGLAVWLVDAGLRGIGSVLGRERWGGRAARSVTGTEDPPRRGGRARR
jgi:cytochrome c-type biogenesis protein CcmH/NrfG